LLSLSKTSSLQWITSALLVSICPSFHSAHAQASHQTCTTADHYKVIALPLRPARINNAGTIAGTTEDHQPATWTEKDGLHEIELPEAFSAAEPRSMNANGAIVGEATRKDNSLPAAFRYSDAKFSLLSTDRSKAAAINDSGDVGGENSDHLVLWHSQKMLSLGDCCGGTIRAMNNYAQIVGQINDKQGHFSAFVWDSSHGFKSINPTKSLNSTAIAINDSGHILVQAFVPNEIYLQSNGKNTLVKLSPEYASQPLALNNCDQVVGEFGPASDFNHAFIWDQKHGFRNLNELANIGTEWNLESAFDINDRGEIIGIGDRGGEQDVGFLLEPDHVATSPAKKR